MVSIYLFQTTKAPCLKVAALTKRGTPLAEHLREGFWIAILRNGRRTIHNQIAKPREAS